MYAISINGKQHKYRAPDEQTAAARLKQLKEEQERGVAPGAGRILLGDHCQAWMEKIVVNLKPKTQRFYRQMTEHYLLPYLGERKPIKKIAAEDIVDMMNAMRRAGYAEQTIDHVYTVGKTVFAYARKWRKIMFNSFDDVDPPRVRRSIRHRSPKPRPQRCVGLSRTTGSARCTNSHLPLDYERASYSA
jgi:Phage integrase, N-terminal SAM-like domain